MEKAIHIITDALKELVVLPSGVSMDSCQTTAGMFYLNAMMAGFSEIGVNVGFTYVNSLGDDITVPDAALEPIVKNLAIELNPVFQDSLSSKDLFEQAEDGFNLLLSLSIDTVSHPHHPNNLPMGSGNRCFGYENYPTRYDDEILTEQGGNIGPENPND